MIENKNKSILELVREVGYFITSTNYCSTSSIQRKFLIDYNRATQILEILEVLEIVSSYDIAIRSRKILVSGIEEMEVKFDRLHLINEKNNFLLIHNSSNMYWVNEMRLLHLV